MSLYIKTEVDELSACIDSVLTQTLLPAELIISIRWAGF